MAAGKPRDTRSSRGGAAPRGRPDSFADSAGRDEHSPAAGGISQTCTSRAAVGAAQFHASQRAQCDGTWRLVSILQQSMYRITSSAWHHWHRNVTLPPAPKRDTATLLAISEVEALQARLEAAEARAERCANELETVKRATPLIPATAPCKDCQRYAQECLEAQAELEAYRDVVLTHVAKGHQFALPS
eukprot:gnl/TRDRNA2_/TRDRNA2_169032_c0_seq1.p1 gnl/TRDRNA2_/TRDRNA2_169032_c0~~gnl/TRDRNA2_/TRDRNA2_169032_c0_seq1.p1  ORF type:complete len:188 (+),score=27.67 gnl/TRDRNA2_/TRDRNA2_169032_c0_seq1:189-752(+)